MSLISSEKQDDISIISGGQNTILDSISPSYIDVTNPKYLLIDNYYVASLLVVNYSKEMNDTFLKKCVCLDIDMQISMFYEKKNSYEIIKELTYNIGNTGANIKESSENQLDIDVMGSSYQDAKYIRKQLQLGDEDFYYLYMYIAVYAASEKALENDLQRLEGVLLGNGLNCRRANFRQEQAFLSTIPILKNHNDLKTVTARNVLTSGLISTYPFIANTLCDENGIVIGINEANHSLIMVDRFESNKYRNANMCILGTSGSGKSYFTKLMIARNRYLNICQYIIDPDREYVNLCKKLDGTLIKFGGEYSINIMDIRKSSNDDTASEGYLRNKISKLNIFFKMLLSDITLEEEAVLEEKIIECYKEKEITFDDNSLYEEVEEGKILSKKIFKNSEQMPVISDLYNILKKDKKAKRLVNLLKPILSGSLKFLNRHTNVDLSNKLVVADIYDIEENNLAPVMFVITDYFWDKIKEERAQKKILYFDEAWKLIASNDETANFIFKIFKTIRKYGGAATAITQDVNDFLTLQNGKFGKGIIDNSSIKCMFQIEPDAIQTMKSIACLSEEECYRLKNMERGTCLLHADNSHLMVKIEASPKENYLITTDRKDIEIRGNF